MKPNTQEDDAVTRSVTGRYYVPRKYPGAPEVSLLELLSTSSTRLGTQGSKLDKFFSRKNNSTNFSDFFFYEMAVSDFN